MVVFFKLSQVKIPYKYLYRPKSIQKDNAIFKAEWWPWKKFASSPKWVGYTTDYSLNYLHRYLLYLKNYTFITSAMVSGQEEMIPWWERGSAAALVEELSHSLCETLLSRTLAVTRSRHRIMQDTHAQTCYWRYALDLGMCQCSCGASTTWPSKSALVPDSWWRFEAPLKLR